MVIKDEEFVVNDAIQYWKGFEDALKWAKSKNNSEEIDEQLLMSQEMVQTYRERLHSLRKAKKNARRNGRN